MSGDVGTVAIVEDDPIIGASLAQRFAIEGIATQWWRSGEEALAGFARHRPQLVVCDIRLPDLDGEALFGRSTRLLGPVPFLFITAFGDVEQAVRLVRAGAVGYITKPFAADELVAKLRDLVAAETARSDGSLGVSPAMRAIEVLLRRVARIDSHVLFLGESGVGKEVCARFLHAVSPRAEAPFVAVNCAAIPAELVESELFGHSGARSPAPSGVTPASPNGPGRAACSSTRWGSFPWPPRRSSSVSSRIAASIRWGGNGPCRSTPG